jgi:hypothetical protein
MDLIDGMETGQASLEGDPIRDLDCIANLEGHPQRSGAWG